MPLSLRDSVCCNKTEWFGGGSFLTKAELSMLGIEESDESSMQRLLRSANVTYQLRSSLFHDVTDINLRLGTNEINEFGSTFDVMLAWMVFKIQPVDYSIHEFEGELGDEISNDLFFFSTPKKNIVALRSGKPKDYTLLKKVPTITLLVSLVLFLLYCALSFVVEFFKQDANWHIIEHSFERNIHRCAA
eukprot:IDg14713t1